MKEIVKLISITIFSMLFISIAEARMLTYVIIGDSIMSGVANSTMNGPDGQAKELAANIVMNSRNVSIRNLSSPGNSLGSKDHTGFGNTLATSSALNMVGGYWTAFDGIIIQAGTNDFGRDLHWAETVDSLRNIMGYSRQYFGANEQANGLELHLNAAGQKKYAEWIMQSASKFGFF